MGGGSRKIRNSKSALPTIWSPKPAWAPRPVRGTQVPVYKEERDTGREERRWGKREWQRERSLSSREDVIRDQRVLRKLQRSLTAHAESSGQLYPPGGTKTVRFSNTGEEQGLGFLMMVAD